MTLINIAKSVGGAWKENGALVDMSKLKQLTEDIVVCQRNWDEDFDMPKEHMDYIIDCCTTVPTKQQEEIYSIVAITKRKIIKKLFAHAYSKREKIATKNKNSQVLANLLLLYIPGPIAKTHFSYGIAVGMSANAAALAGAELGYKTGFCKCMETLDVRTVIEKFSNVKIDAKPMMLMLGIGKPDDNFDPRDVVVGGKKINEQESHGTKEIKVHWLT